MKRTTTLIIILVIIVSAAFAAWHFFPWTKGGTTNSISDPDTSANTNGAGTYGPADLYFVAVGDDGTTGTKLGCGDSLVAARGAVALNEGLIIQDRISAVLTRLLSLHDQYYGESGLYNALYQSQLSVQRVTYANAAYTVALTGTLKQGGECDTPRIESQIAQTVKQFTGTDGITVTLNGQLLSQALSLK